jgi:hypothetical protein
VKKIFLHKSRKGSFFCEEKSLHTTKLHLGFCGQEKRVEEDKKGEEKEKENWEEFEKCFGIEFGCEEDEEEEEEEEEESPKRLQFWWICLMGFGFLEDLCLEMAAAGGGVAVVLVCTGMMRRKSTLMGKMRLVFLL